jgi:hypothetical protein
MAIIDPPGLGAPSEEHHAFIIRVAGAGAAIKRDARDPIQRPRFRKDGQDVGQKMRVDPLGILFIRPIHNDRLPDPGALEHQGFGGGVGRGIAHHHRFGPGTAAGGDAHRIAISGRSDGRFDRGPFTRRRVDGGPRGDGNQGVKKAQRYTICPRLHDELTSLC